MSLSRSFGRGFIGFVGLNKNYYYIKIRVNQNYYKILRGLCKLLYTFRCLSNETIRSILKKSFYSSVMNESHLPFRQRNRYLSISILNTLPISNYLIRHIRSFDSFLKFSRNLIPFVTG